VLNKIDLLPYTSFDLATATEDIVSINPQVALIKASCRTGEGLEEWYDWLRRRVAAQKQLRDKGV